MIIKNLLWEYGKASDLAVCSELGIFHAVKNHMDD